ncbi:hypothetical protein [Streptomyces sp. XH2]|uniref:hypothetical protein n=1 Tax=Streptomyces sp. XH2 TaxID=3412483 RepID=UPI003C7C461F
MSAGTPVTVDEPVDGLYADDPPASARVSVADRAGALPHPALAAGRPGRARQRHDRGPVRAAVDVGRRWRPYRAADAGDASVRSRPVVGRAAASSAQNSWSARYVRLAS